ncbi:MAG: hypothetical protein FRX48_00164 [Lasallia pustulata]|uniref:Vezatin n=1 Tax=Lasallia pustulata TaxID=136370 RepID=A0A5M8Q305_9LECA|nr:MAG: hypothetical protein FRX48_00164 [Lasallia pustulata]
MDSVIFQDSPLAFYLEGEGKAEHEWATTTPGKEPASLEPLSFAPTGLPKAYSKFRRKLPRALNLSLEVPSARGLVGSLQNNCSRALNSRLGRPDNTHFLEQFRYTIVASQLLSDHAHTNSYKPSIDPSLADTGTEKQSREAERVAISWQGVSSTGGLAFVLVWSLHWARGAANVLSGTLRIALVTLIFATAIALSYAFVRRQWLHYLRHQAVDGASQFVSTAQAYDGAATAAITLIQEVELVSRGYRISSPLPPITRMEEKSQTRRCSKLRHVLQSAVVSLVGPYRQACEDLKPLANEFDLEKYYDIYEISRADLQEAKDSLAGLDLEDGESLKALRFALQQLHILKKIVLCSLLALHADGGKLDFSKWATAVDVMQQLSSLTTDATSRMDMVLNEEERFSMPPTPKAPLTPGKESLRSQIKKLGSLSQGIRGLQAKMHILREESNKTLELSEDNSDLRMNLLVQYDSIGTDLKALVDEWENGRAALAVNIEKNERRISLSSAGFLSPRSPPTSLGGITAIESSPIDALRLFSADERSRSSAEPSSSDDEIFEAVALPRQRNTLTRDERIAKMKEDRIRQAVVREKAEANTHMLKELETVIKLRPRGRTTGRMTSV